MTKQTCVYCKKESEDFTKEHVVPRALGGDITLVNLVCKSCNNAFSKEFEHENLKGSGFISFFRAVKGQKGRHETPIYGLHGHGREITYNIKENFPPIRCIIGKDRNLTTPLQMVIESEEHNYEYILVNEESGKLEIKQLLDKLFNQSRNKDRAKKVYLWANSKDIFLYSHRNLNKDFYIWLGENKLKGEYYASFLDQIVLPINWNPEDWHRLFCKTVLNFVFWLLEDREKCLLNNFDNIREFVRYDKFKEHNFVRLWDDSKPEISKPEMPFLNGIEYDLLVSVFEWNERIIGALHVNKIGLFLIDIGSSFNSDEKLLKTIIFKNGRKSLQLSGADSESFRNNICNYPYFEKILQSKL